MHSFHKRDPKGLEARRQGEHIRGRVGVQRRLPPCIRAFVEIAQARHAECIDVSWRQAGDQQACIGKPFSKPPKAFEASPPFPVVDGPRTARLAAADRDAAKVRVRATSKFGPA